MASPHMPRKRSISIAGHRTSISLEEPFWEALRSVAEEKGLSVPALVADIDSGREGTSLSSTIRVYLLRHYQIQCDRSEPD